MKIYLASFLEPDNFGKGRLFSIASNNKFPSYLKLTGKFSKLAPSIEIMNNYIYKKYENKDEAASSFRNEFSNQLDSYLNEINDYCLNNNCNINDVLSLCDNDTLLSWERKGNPNYRDLVAEFLKKINYEVVLN